MSKIEKQDVTAEEAQKISSYVKSNYKHLEKIEHFYISQSNSCYYISVKKDESPLILGKGII